MTFTRRRWAVTTVVTCLTAVVAFLPLQRESYWDSANTRLRISDPLFAWNTRSAARARHLSDLILQQRTGDDIAAATRVFGATPSHVGDPDIIVASDVPAATERNVRHLIAAEREQHGAARGRGRVGVLVLRDSIAHGDARTSSAFRFFDWPLKKRVIAPSAATGDRCVVVLHTRKGWLDAPNALPGASASLLDACAFYDVFGAPGAGTARDLRAAHFETARRFQVRADSAPPARFRFSYASGRGWGEGVFGNDPIGSLGCRAGRDSACLALTEGVAPGPAREGWQDDRWQWQRAGSSPDASSELAWRFSGAGRLYEALEHDLGPSRFAQLWSSDRPLPQAYRNATGESLAQWVRRREERAGGLYVAGPWNPAWSTGLTLLTRIPTTRPSSEIGYSRRSSETTSPSSRMNFQRLPVPFAELFGQPDGMLFGIENVERVSWGVDSFAVGEVVLDKKSEGDGLWFDAELTGIERATDGEGFFVVATGSEEPFPFCWLGDVIGCSGLIFDANPLHADRFDAEIVLTFQFERQGFRV